MMYAFTLSDRKKTGGAGLSGSRKKPLAFLNCLK